MEQQLIDLVSWARDQSEILALYLYGSLPEGRANSLSDVDVGILVKPEISMPRLWGLEDHWLAQWPGHIDLRVLNSAPLSFRYEVTARGQRLWAADVGIVADIESLIWRQYWDLRPKLEQDWGYYFVNIYSLSAEEDCHATTSFLCAGAGRSQSATARNGCGPKCIALPG